jgi:hypothetical protein
MPLLKRLGLLFLDVSIFIFCLILTLFLIGAAIYIWPPLAWPSAVLGFAGSMLLFFRLRKRSYKSKIEHEAARFLAARRAAALHPRRAKYFRLVRPYVLWLPSACALLVLLFFPQTTHLFHPRFGPEDRSYSVFMFLPRASHLFHPGADHAIHNHIHIPWNWTITYTFKSSTDAFSNAYVVFGRNAPWPFGKKPFWTKTARASAAVFSSINAAELLDRRKYRALQLENPYTITSILEFHSHGITLTCGRHLWYPSLPDGDYWIVDCETTSPLQERNLDAHFYGSAEDIPAFYQILQAVSPAH